MNQQSRPNQQRRRPQQQQNQHNQSQSRQNNNNNGNNHFSNAFNLQAQAPYANNYYTTSGPAKNNTVKPRNNNGQQRPQTSHWRQYDATGGAQVPQPIGNKRDGGHQNANGQNGKQRNVYKQGDPSGSRPPAGPNGKIVILQRPQSANVQKGAGEASSKPVKPQAPQINNQARNLKKIDKNTSFAAVVGSVPPPLKANAKSKNAAQTTIESKPKKQAPKTTPLVHVGGSTDFPTDWDINNYKYPHEDVNHWELRKSFMELHKQSFPEDTLVCMAQTFLNIELMGCQYPAETMRRIEELSKDIVDKYRASREGFLKRTFMGANEAAERRAKGRLNQQQRGGGADEDFGRKPRIQFGTGKELDLFEGLRFGQLVLNLHGNRSCLSTCAARYKMKYEERISEPTEKGVTAQVLLNGEVIAESQADTQKTAKAQVFQIALKLLQSHCYTIKLNVSRDVVKLQKSVDGNIKATITKDAGEHSNAGKAGVNSENKGYRIMRLMGWTGGGLGKFSQGREEPIEHLIRGKRSGLGSRGGNFHEIIKNYIDSSDIRDLKFDPSFTKEERAKLHSLAARFNLRSQSTGKGDERQLVICKKLDWQQILREVLLHRNQKYCDRYFIQVPECKAYLFPGHAAMLDLQPEF